MVSVFWLTAQVRTAEGAVSGWSATGSLGTARDSHTATLLPNGKVLIAGGDNTGVPLTSAELYDPATGLFSPTGSMGSARFNHIAVLLPTGKVLVAGGNNPGILASAELYDPATGTFTATGSLTSARGNPSAVLLPNGKVLVAGGRGANDFLTFSHSSAELYDPATGTFSATGSMGSSREWHMMTLLTNGKVLASGGAIIGVLGNVSPLASAELYDPATGAFAATGSMGTARYNPTATGLAGGKVLVAGGSADGISILSSAELYDPATGAFSATGSMTFTVFNETATLLPDDTVLFAGGVDASGIPTIVAQTYDPASGSFSFAPLMATARHNHFATESRSTPLPGGKVLVAGGIGVAGGSLASAELFVLGDTPPRIGAVVPAGDISGNVGSTFTKTFSYSDPNGGPLAAAIAPAGTAIPAFCTFVDNAAAQKATITCNPILPAHQGTTSGIRIVVTDNTAPTALSAASAPFSITVNNLAPTIADMPDRTAVTGDNSVSIQVPVLVSDPDGNAVTLDVAVPTKGWISFDNVARQVVIRGPIPATDNGTYTVTVNVTDNGTPPRQATNSFTVTVNNSVLPPSDTVTQGGGGGGGCTVAGTRGDWRDGVGAWAAFLLLALGLAIRRGLRTRGR